MNVKNCSNKGTITGTGKQVGGIVGLTNGAKIEKCVNTGDVIGEYNFVGGICGGMAGENAIITNCVNKGTIEGEDGIGGICGGFAGMIESCYNEGSIKAKGSSYAVGGIIGTIIKLANGKAPILEICNTYNKGAIYAQSSTGSGNIGGILGTAYLLDIDSKLTLTNNYNIGKIEILETANPYVGGIVGEVGEATVTASNNYYLADNSYSADNTIGEIKTSSEMKTQAFVTLLNTSLTELAWEIRAKENNGYPVLKGVR